jgi:hypothetical protein
MLGESNRSRAEAQISDQILVYQQGKYKSDVY